MASISLLSFFLVFSSFLHLGFSDNNAAQLLQRLSEAAGGSSLACMEKLMPCKASLKSPNDPQEECCLPLEEVIDSDTKCLCSFLNDPKMLQSMNVTEQEALKLPEACNLQVDISTCKGGSEQTIPSTGSDPTPTPKEGSAPTTPSTASGSASAPAEASAPTAGSGSSSIPSGGVVTEVSPKSPPSESSATKITLGAATSMIALAFAAY